MINQYLDKNGLTYFWTKIKNYVDTNSSQYVLPIASESTLGGIKTGYLSKESGYLDYNKIQVDENGNAYVVSNSRPYVNSTVDAGNVGCLLRVLDKSSLSSDNTHCSICATKMEITEEESGSRNIGILSFGDFNLTTSFDGSTQTSLNLGGSSQYLLAADGSWVDKNTLGGGEPGTGGDTVSLSNRLSSGTRIVTMNISGTNYDLYAPSSESGDSISISNLLPTGTRIATLTINGTPYTLNAPAGEGPVQAGDTVTLSNRLLSGTRIVTMNISGSTYDIYAPNSGGSTVEVKNTLGGGTRIATIVVDNVEHDIYQQRTGSNYITKDGDSGMTGDYTYSTSTNIYAGAFYENSDINIKENIEDIKDIEKAKDVDFVQFNFKDDGEKRVRYGVIAQDLESVGLNNLVNENADGVKSVDYISLLCLKIAELEQRINELENK